MCMQQKPPMDDESNEISNVFKLMNRILANAVGFRPHVFVFMGRETLAERNGYGADSEHSFPFGCFSGRKEMAANGTGRCCDEATFLLLFSFLFDTFFRYFFLPFRAGC